MRAETFQSEDLELFVDFAIKQNEVWTEMALTIAFQIPMQGVIAIILFQRVKRNVFCESFDKVLLIMIICEKIPEFIFYAL